MDNKKYEELINLVINENQDAAKELFHEIVVEKSREIFESIMAEEMDEDLEEGMGGQVGDLLDEINAEESGVAEDDEGLEIGGEAGEGDDFGGMGDDTDVEISHDDMGDMDTSGQGGEEVEDAVIRIEDKLDQLMAEFEQIMGAEGGDDLSGDEEVDVDVDADSDGEDADIDVDADADMGDEDEEPLAEAVQLQKVPVTHGDDGAQKKSPVPANSGKAGMDSKPVKFSGEGAEKGRTTPSSKDLPGAGKFKNAPGHKSQDLEKAPAPTKKDGASGTKSPVAK